MKSISVTLGRGKEDLKIHPLLAFGHLLMLFESQFLDLVSFTSWTEVGIFTTYRIVKGSTSLSRNETINVYWVPRG